jgi:hypothetical protein
MDEVEPSLPTALYHYFISEKQNKTSLPTDYGHHFPTYMKIKKQGTLLHTYDTHCTFSHRTCTSFIQIHLGILTALIFCIGLLMLHILMCCEWRRCSGMGDALIWVTSFVILLLWKNVSAVCADAVCLSPSLSVSQSVCLSLSLSVCLSPSLSVSQSVCLSLSLSVCQSVYLSLCLSLSLSVCLSVYLSLCLSVCLSVSLSDCLSVCLSVSLSICLSVTRTAQVLFVGQLQYNDSFKH